MLTAADKIQVKLLTPYSAVPQLPKIESKLSLTVFAVGAEAARRA